MIKSMVFKYGILWTNEKLSVSKEKLNPKTIMDWNLCVPGHIKSYKAKKSIQLRYINSIFQVILLTIWKTKT